MTEILHCDDEGFTRAAAALSAGDLVAFATETVYGLGADATKAQAVAKIYEAKGRPSFNPLIVHLADIEAAKALVLWNERAQALAEAFWPGPLTLILPRAADCPVSLLCSAGLDSLALRVPAKASARELLRRCGRPIAAPSANRSGRISPTRAQHVLAELEGRVDFILDDGPCEFGLESSVLSLLEDGPQLLRPGAITAEEIEALIGPLSGPRSSPGGEDQALSSPGLLASHYAPAARLRLKAPSPRGDEAYLDFGGQAPETKGKNYLDLSPQGDLLEAASNLFDYLRRLDESGARAIAVAPIPETGLGVAINDRLKRAAAPRP